MLITFFFFFANEDKEDCDEILKHLNQKAEVKQLGNNDYLGIQIQEKDGRYFFNQKQGTVEFLNYINLKGAKLVNIPMETNYLNPQGSSEFLPDNLH